MNEESGMNHGGMTSYNKGISTTPTPVSFLMNSLLSNSNVSTPGSSTFDLSSPGFTVPNHTNSHTNKNSIISSTPTPHFSLFDKPTPLSSTTSTTTTTTTSAAAAHEQTPSSSGMNMNTFPTKDLDLLATNSLASSVSSTSSTLSTIASSLSEPSNQTVPRVASGQRDGLDKELNPFKLFSKMNSVNVNSINNSSNSNNNNVNSNSNSNGNKNGMITALPSSGLDTPTISNMFNWPTSTPLPNVMTSTGTPNPLDLQSQNQQRILDLTPSSTPNPIVVDVVKFQDITSNSSSSSSAPPNSMAIAAAAAAASLNSSSMNVNINMNQAEDTYLKNCQKLDLAPHHLPPEGERSTPKKMRVSMTPEVEYTPLASIPVPRKKKNVEDGPDVTEKKKTRRRERCRLAAARFRNKKKVEAEQLESENKGLVDEKEELQRSIQLLKSRIIASREFILKHKDCF